MQLFQTLCLLSVLVTLPVKATASLQCKVQAYPTPRYHALGEGDLEALDLIIAHTITHIGAAADIFDRNSTANDVQQENRSFKISDQIIQPVEGDKRALLGRTTNKAGDQDNVILIGWIWTGAGSCVHCSAEDDDHRLLKSRHLEGLADALMISILESGIQYFADVTCVTFSCDGSDTDEISVGCLA